MSILEEIIDNNPNLAYTTRETYKTAVREYVRYAGTDPSKWTEISVEDWRDSLLTNGINPGTIKRYLSGLKHAVKRLVKRGKLPIDIVSNVETPRIKNTSKKRKAITEDDAKRMLATCTTASVIDVRDAAILTTGFYTGIRKSEILQLSFENIIFVGATPIAANVTIKGGDIHYVPFNIRVQTALASWVGMLNSAGITTGRLFRGVRGTTIQAPLSTVGFYKIVVERAKKAGITTKVHPHIMRHSFISWLVAKGVPAVEIRSLTGQKTDSMITHYSTNLNNNPASNLLDD